MFLKKNIIFIYCVIILMIFVYILLYNKNEFYINNIIFLEKKLILIYCVVIVK